MSVSGKANLFDQLFSPITVNRIATKPAANHNIVKNIKPRHQIISLRHQANTASKRLTVTCFDRSNMINMIA